MARLLIKDTLRSRADGVNVAIPVEYRERIAMQQDQSAAVGQRRLGANIEVIFYLDNIGVWAFFQRHK